MLSTLKSVKKFKLPNISENLFKINKFSHKINYKHNFKSFSSPIKFNKFGLLDNHKTFSIYKNYLHSTNKHIQAAQNIQVDEQIKVEQVNEQIKTEQVNEQIKTEQIKTEQINEQIKTEQVNNSTQDNNKTNNVNTSTNIFLSKVINWGHTIIAMIISLIIGALSGVLVIIGVLPFYLIILEVGWKIITIIMDFIFFLFYKN